MRRMSNPVADRCGTPYAEVLTSACTSIKNGRTPSIIAEIATPLNPSLFLLNNNSLGFTTSRNPLPCISYIANSSVLPKRFLFARNMRYI